MADYDKYMNRMQRIAAKMPLIRKIVFTLIGVLCVTLLCGLVILCTKVGEFTSEMHCENVTYGDELNYGAETVITDVTYFFAKADGEEWSEEIPYRVGKYVAKAVSKTFFGDANESVCSFEITKRDLKAEILCTSAEYSSEVVLEVKYSNLAKGDIVTKENVDYILPKNTGEGRFFKLCEGGVTVINERQEDVSDCYRLVSEDAPFEVTKREAETTGIEYKAEESLLKSDEEKAEQQDSESEKMEESELDGDSHMDDVGSHTDGDDNAEDDNVGDDGGEGVRGEGTGYEVVAHESVTAHGGNNANVTDDVSGFPEGQNELPGNVIARDRSELQGDSEEPLFKIKSDETHDICIRSVCFGDYETGGVWKEAPIYKPHVLYMPLQFCAKMIKANGIKSYKVLIEPIEYNALTASLLPYYSLDYEMLYEDDTAVINEDRKLYEFNTYYSEPESLLFLSKNRNNNSIEENTYRNYVRNNYLFVDSEQETALVKIAKEAGLSKDSETIITDVANYIRNVAKYNLSFGAYPAGEDPVLHFLTEGKEGVCQHFASAATLMYRVLGVPARYTEGFLVTCQKNEWQEVNWSDAHAWVEVYADDIGWIQVDVTGGESQQYEEQRQPGERGEITIKMKDVEVYFDTLQKESSYYEIKDGKLADGDSLSCKGSAKETYVGTYINECAEYCIVDSSGNDVTDCYNVKCIPGFMIIKPISITGPSEIRLKEKLDCINLDSYEWNRTGIERMPKFTGLLGTESGKLEIQGNTLRGAETGIVNLTAYYENYDYNGDGVFEILNNNEHKIKVVVEAFSNVNATMKWYDADDNPKNFDVISEGEYRTITDAFGNKYNYLTVAMESASKQYDGEYLCCDEAELIDGRLYPGDRMVVKSSTAIKYAGTKPNRCGELRIVDSDGKDVTGDYYIVIYDGTLTVETQKVVLEELEYSTTLWRSDETEKLFEECTLELPRRTIEVPEGDNIVSVKNGAFSAANLGKTELIGHNEQDINGDGVGEYEYSQTVILTVRLSLMECLLLLLLLIIVVIAIIKL